MSHTTTPNEPEIGTEVETILAPLQGFAPRPIKDAKRDARSIAAITKLMFNGIVDHNGSRGCVGTIRGCDEDPHHERHVDAPLIFDHLHIATTDEDPHDYDYQSDDPHDYDDYECEESGNCTKCCEIDECTSKHAFANQGQWETDPGLYVSCPHCEPFGGAERPVMSSQRYDCKGYPGEVDNTFDYFLTRIPVEKLIQKRLFIPFLQTLNYCSVSPSK